jgi:hypothetical protein
VRCTDLALSAPHLLRL